MNNPIISSDERTIANFRIAMRRLTSTVSIIATQSEGEPYGMIATSLTSVSTSPPSILVCINKSASLYRPCIETGLFTVNLLTTEQASLVSIFSGEFKGNTRFQFGHWEYIDELPYLTNAQATLFCTTSQRTNYSSHEIIIATVDHSLFEERVIPLLWQDGKPAASTPIVEH